MYLSKVFVISILFKICASYGSLTPLAYSEVITTVVMWPVPLDHFNHQDKRLWISFLNIDTRHYKVDGPIYLLATRPHFLHSPQLVYELAAKTHGIVAIPLNDRINGLAQNFKSRDDVKYVTTKQMLADLVYVIRYLKLSYNVRRSKVVVVGDGFGATLAVWLRQMYPEDCDIAIADSAHLLAKFEVPEYLESVTDVLKKSETPECVEKISNYFNRTDTLLKTAEGIEEFKEEYNVCKDVNMTDELNQQYYIISKINSVIAHKEYPPICDRPIEETPLPPVCQNDTFESFVEMTFKWPVPWLENYMQCNELGWFMTSSQNQMFSKRLVKDYYLEWCKKLYGFTEKEILEKMEDTNKVYGGLRPNVTQVIFTYGGRDPNRFLGVTKYLSPAAPVLDIQDYANDEFLYHYLYNDEIIKALKYVTKTVTKWLGL